MSTFHARSCRGYREKRWTDGRKDTRTHTHETGVRTHAQKPRDQNGKWPWKWKWNGNGIWMAGPKLGGARLCCAVGVTSPALYCPSIARDRVWSEILLWPKVRSIAIISIILEAMQCIIGERERPNRAKVRWWFSFVYYCHLHIACHRHFFVALAEHGKFRACAPAHSFPFVKQDTCMQQYLHEQS